MVLWGRHCLILLCRFLKWPLFPGVKAALESCKSLVFLLSQIIFANIWSFSFTWNIWLILQQVWYFLISKFRPHYNLILQSIAVNGQLLQINPAVFATSSNRGTIVDSGTTLAYLVQEAYDPFVSAVSMTILSIFFNVKQS